MRRFIPGLLAMLMLFSAAEAKTYTNKTFLTPRSDNMNLAMEYTTWHKQVALKDDKKFGGTVQAVGFYTESDNEKDLGKYFGVTNYDNGDSQDDFFAVRPAKDPSQPVHIFADYVFHTPNTSAASDSLRDKIQWRPDRQAYGVRLDYNQKLDKLVDGLYFQVSLPIVHVETSMGFRSTDTAQSSQNLKNANAGAPADLGGTSHSVTDYLTGNVENTYTLAKQAKLTHAKIHNDHSETGVADIDFKLGYNFLYEATKHVGVTVAFTAPTGGDPDGEWLWEAQVGNNGHWALGFGFDSAFQMWKDDNMSLDILFAFNYRYLFSSTEKRTMGITFPNATGFGTSATKKALYGQYQLAAKVGDTEATPFANFLTRDLKVTPGSHFDGIVQFAFNYDNWTFDLGYNLFAKEAEDVRTKSGTWTDDTYAFIESTWITTTPFVIATHGFGGADGHAINHEHLDLDACTQPSVVTHKLYGGFGYAFNEWEYPFLIGAGASYEWGTDNDSLDQWALWLKLGLTF